MKRLLPLTLCCLLLLLSLPVAALANEGVAWYYLFMAPFALFATPFFLTIVFVTIAVLCYWQYRTSGNKSRGVAAVLVLLLIIPLAFRDKASFVAERESRQRAERMVKERREARLAGKHVSPDFKAMSTAYAQKYQASAKTEKDRLNFQAGQDMLRMARDIDSMQKKEPLPPDPAVEKEGPPPARSAKTLLFELYALAQLAAAGWAGAFIARWRTRRRLNTLVHLAPLTICLFLPALAQLPFIVMFAAGTGERIYVSWLSMIGSTPMSFMVVYLLGILSYHWRGRHTGEIPTQASAHGEVQREIQQAEPVAQDATDEFVYFACPGCKLAGRIAAARLPERGLLATCPECNTGFPVRHDAAISTSPAAAKYCNAGSSAPQETVLAEAGSTDPPGIKQYLASLAACRSYFLLQILAIILSWQLGQRIASVPLILMQLLAFALPAPLACGCVLATRKSSGFAAQLTGMILALIAAITAYAVQVAASRSFPLQNLVYDSAFRYALMAFGSGFAGVAAGWFFAAAEKRYWLTPQVLFTATLRRLRENSFLLTGWCIFVLIEGLMSLHFHGEAGLIVLPIVAVVDNLPFLVVWLLARAASVEEVPSTRLAAILFAGFYALMTTPLHSAGMVLNPVGIFFQKTPFIGLGVTVCALIALAWFRTRKAVGAQTMQGVASLLPGGSCLPPVRSAVLAIAVLVACYGSYNGSRERFDLKNLFAAQAYPEIAFTDPAGKPLPHLPVSVQRIGSEPISFLNIHAEQGGRVTLETDAGGILHLPSRKARLATLGFAGLFSGRRHIYLTPLDLGWQVTGSGLSPSYELREVTTRETIACKPADMGESLKHGAHLINLMPLKSWENAVATLENRAGSLKNLSPAQLLDLAGPCNRLISTTCDRIDNALLDHPETPELIRKMAIDNFKVFASVTRSGNYAEPILAALEQDKRMSSWMDLLHKEMRLEAKAKSEAAKADGRTAAVIHEEALKLHKQGKKAEAFALYQAVFAAPGPMLPRYFGNSSYACSSLGMRSWAMRLAREGLRLKPDHDRSAHSYAQEAYHFTDYEAAKTWAGVSVATGFTDNDVHKLLGAASMKTGDRLTAAACLWRPLKYDGDETWIMPYLERIGPRPFWQPIQKL